MREISLGIPELGTGENNVEIEIRLNGKQTIIQYRVEVLKLASEDLSSAERVKKIKIYLDKYDNDWELIQIGNPSKDEVPLTFKRK